MPASKFVDFRTIKQSVSMEQILEHYGLLAQFTRNDDRLSGPCPIHKGDNPTAFRVSLSKNCWNCFSECRRGGNILDFVSLMENVTVQRAASLIADWFGVESSQPRSSRASTTTPRAPSQQQRSGSEKKSATREKQGDDVGDENRTENPPLTFTLEHLKPDHPYLVERGLTAETIATFGLGYCEKGIHAGRIAIPIHNRDGKLVAYAGRWPGDPPEGTEKYKLPKGFKKTLELFNLHRTIQEKSDQPLVIVEGFFDCIKLWQSGIRRVVALMGSSLSAAQEDLIRKHTDAQTRVLLMLDEDDAGRAARDEIAARLAKFVFVKVHVFAKEMQQPEDLSEAELASLIGGAS